MRTIPASVDKLIEQLKRLPGIGPRSAERLTFYLLRMPQDEVVELAMDINNARMNSSVCEECFTISEGRLCPVCQNTFRNRSQIMVVEEPLDMLAIEKTGRYEGVYHVLGGVIDPVRGIGAEELNVKELINRVAGYLGNYDSIEVILATNPSTEGETTALYLRKVMKDVQDYDRVRLTRIARGLPVGGDVEYADPITLQRALEGRDEY
ncbi:recombination protein RecR [candidate division WWE3 bacterium]|uniref:Recombination protein RecR n=1 Tax=candidate division WWE3 bacterium TaxID=2053526 RepID=A0A955LL80_UNCKA|nr:recombination protein RecR [candidate division WWE3 bacterium]